MSDLQAAIKSWDKNQGMLTPELEIIVDAARRVADLDAATERILDRLGMHEHTQRDWDKAQELAKAALALGITENIDGRASR
jgi:hypothetical protein